MPPSKAGTEEQNSAAIDASLMARKPKRENLKPPGRCIFCGRVAGTRDPDTGKAVKMSKQHLFPVWMHTPFPKTAKSHIERHVSYQADLGPSWNEPKQGDPRARQLRIICEAHCNNGWISELEDQTKQFMLPMMKGENLSLDESQQKLLALWICVVTIVWEFTDTSNIVIPASDRKYVYQTREPPSTWTIWVGQNKGTGWPWGRTHYSFTIPPPELRNRPPNKPLPKSLRKNYQISSLQVAELFTQATSTTDPDMLRFERLVSLKLMGLHRVWPAIRRNIEWPSNHLLDDQKAFFHARRTHIVATKFR
jgi:hypothetical protein